MNDKRYKTLISLMVAMLLVSVALFALDNYFASQDINDATVGGNEQETIVIYRAIRDIPTYTVLTPNMFEPVTIPKISDVGFITDINTVVGTYSRGWMFKGNFLTQSSFTTDNFEEGLSYSVEIRIDYSGNIAYGDIVDVYAVANNGTVLPLFTNKKLYQQTGQTGSAVTKIYVKVTRDELISYYSVLNSYKIAVIPVDTNQVGPNPQIPQFPQEPQNPQEPQEPVEPGQPEGNN